MKYKVTLEFVIESTDYDPEPQNADEVKAAYLCGDIDSEDETLTVVPA